MASGEAVLAVGGDGQSRGGEADAGHPGEPTVDLDDPSAGVAAGGPERLHLATIDHRLKTSFLVIAGWAKTLDEEWDRLTPEQKRQGIAAIRARAESMVVQAEQLLAQLRPDALVAVLAESTDLARLCRQAVEAYDASTSHRVVYRGSASLPVAASTDTVDQIIEQLLENAIKFSPAGSVVEASVHDTAQGALLLVTDEGGGIPHDIDIFRPFARGHPDVPGTGIGLSVVASLTRALGGTVAASGRAGGGSQFEVVLPRAPAP